MEMRDLIVPQNQFNNVNVVDIPPELEIRKPKGTEFIRVVGGADYSAGPFAMHENQIDNFVNEFYLVAPNMTETMKGYFWPVKFVLTVNRDDNFFLWPIKLSDKKGRSTSALKSTLKAEEEARTKWVRVEWNGRKYKTIEAKNDRSIPDIPQQTFSQLLKLAIQDRVIDSPDHFIVKKLEGRI